MYEVSPTQTGARLIRKLQPLFNVFQRWGLVMYTVFLFKNILILALRNASLQHLGWLDCYIPGRPVLGSRIPDASKLIVILADIFLIYQRLNFRRVGASFNLYYLELVYFTHLKLRTIITWLPTPKLDEQPRPRPQLQQLLAVTLTATGAVSVTADSTAPRPPPSDDSWAGEKHPLLEEHFVSQLDARQLVRRPMRTPSYYRKYAYVHLLGLSLAISLQSCALLLSGLMVVPMLLTRRGFEVTHKECVRFLVTQTAARNFESTARHYAHIYPVERGAKLGEIFDQRRQPPLFLPLEDFVPFSWFHVANILVEILESFSIWLGMGVCYMTTLYGVIACSLEVGAYARELRHQLAQLAAKWRRANLEQARQATLFRSENVVGVDTTAASTLHQMHATPVAQAASQEQDGASQPPSPFLDDVARIQACILDFYSFVALANPFVGANTLVNMIIWLFYTFLIFVRILRVDRLQTVTQLDHGVQVEFFALFCCCLLVVSVLLVSTSLVESEARKLYRDIIPVLVLDPGLAGSKLRWCTLLNYFEPKKLYCFTMLNYTSLSWLFCIKVISWVISAMVILKSL